MNTQTTERPTLVTMMFLAERYGPRLDMDQLAEVLKRKKATLYNQVSAGTLEVKTYLDGGKRFADFQDVAEHLASCRKRASSGLPV